MKEQAPPPKWAMAICLLAIATIFLACGEFTLTNNSTSEAMAVVALNGKEGRTVVTLPRNKSFSMVTDDNAKYRVTLVAPADREAFKQKVALVNRAMQDYFENRSAIALDVAKEAAKELKASVPAGSNVSCNGKVLEDGVTIVTISNATSGGLQVGCVDAPSRDKW